MGDVQGAEAKEVRGILIAGDFDSGARSAARSAGDQVQLNFTRTTFRIHSRPPDLILMSLRKEGRWAAVAQ
jgi:hypothetical protein